jgi:hypothetical protein
LLQPLLLLLLLLPLLLLSWRAIVMMTTVMLSQAESANRPASGRWFDFELGSASIQRRGYSSSKCTQLIRTGEQKEGRTYEGPSASPPGSLSGA